jgi:hypothetical protein
MHVRVTTVAVEKQQVLNILSVGMYSLPYLSGTQIVSSLRLITCNLWPVWLGQVFPHYLINGTTGGKKY